MMIYEFLLRAREQSCLYRTLSVVASQVKQKIQKIQTAAASHSKRGFLFMVMTWDMSSASPSTTVKRGKIYRILMGLLHGNFFLRLIFSANYFILSRADPLWKVGRCGFSRNQNVQSYEDVFRILCWLFFAFFSFFRTQRKMDTKSKRFSMFVHTFCGWFFLWYCTLMWRR